MRTASPRFPDPRPLLFFAVLALVLASCSSGDDGPTDPGGVFNQPPQVSEIEWVAPYLIYVGGDVFVLSVTATDPDGDPLSYQWDWATPAAAGSYDRADTSQAELSIGFTPGQFQARVTVTDGKSNPISRVVGLTVGTAVTGGDIMVNTTWAGADWPLVLDADTAVKAGATLTIQAGTEVQLRKRRVGGSEFSIGLTVEGGGTLLVAGTSSAPVIFRGNKAEAGDDPTHNGIQVQHAGQLELRHFRILQANTGVLKQGGGLTLLEDVTIRDCVTGYVGLEVLAGTSEVTMNRVEIRNCTGAGVNLRSSTGTFERLLIRESGDVGVKLTRIGLSNSPSSATLRRCELDGNAEGNLYVDRNSTVDLSCSNLLAVEGGYNVVFPNDGPPVAGTLPMDNCYWGVSGAASAEEIRDLTFDPDGRVSGDEWRRETDLSGYRASAINFDDGGDVCNQ